MGTFFNPLQLALKPLYDKALADDELFALVAEEKETRAEKPKSFAECCEYILGEAYAYAKEHKDGSVGMAGMSDTDLIGMIKHYYDEDDIEIKKMGASASVKVAKAETKENLDPKKKKEPKAKKSADKSAEGLKASEGVFKNIKQKKQDEPKVSLGDLFSGLFD